MHSSNAIDPNLHVEEPTLDQAVNAHGSLSFKILPTHPEYNNILALMTIVIVYNGDDLIFRGRVIETTQDIYGIISVYCEGELAFLCDSVHTPFTYGGSTATPEDLFRRLIANHNAYTTSVDNSNREKMFTIGQVTVKGQKGYTYSADTARSTWDLLIDGLINPVGGYLRTRHVNDVTYIDYLADYTGTAQQTVEYGKNLLSLEDGIVGGDIITVLLPYGGKPDGVDTRTTIESVNNGKSYIKADAETIAKYRNIWGTQTWDEITDPGQLLLAAQSYLNAQKEALNTVSAEALDLSAVDADMKPIYVGDYVRIISTPHGINKKLLCTAKTTDLADPANTRITIGPKTQTLTAAVKNGDAAIRSSVAAAASVSGVANKALSDAGNAVADASDALAAAEAAQSTAADAMAAAEAAASAAADKAPKAHASTATTYGVGDVSKYGHVKLSDSHASMSGVSGGTAATPSAVKSAYDLAGQAGQTASDAKAAAGDAAALADTAQKAAQAAQASATEAESAATAAVEKASAAAADAQDALTAAQDAQEIASDAQSAVDSKAPKNHASTATTYGIGNAASYGHVRLSDATDSALGEPSGTAATPTAVRSAYAAALEAKSRADEAYARADDAYTSADQAGLDASNAENTATAAQATADAALAAAENAPPKNHAVSVSTTYGAGTAANYGHVRLSDSTSSTSAAASGGTAATPAAVKAAYDLADGKAPKAHASTATTYGAGTSNNYGHVKLSASTSSTSGTSSGVAATPSAVKSAYDLASKAVTTLLGGKKIVCGWSAINFKNTGQQNTTINFGTTFTAKPVVIIGQVFNGVICTVFNDAVSTTGFTVNVPAVGSATLSTRQMPWIAIGSV